MTDPNKHLAARIHSDAGAILLNDPEVMETVLNWHNDRRVDVIARLEYLQQRAMGLAQEMIDEDQQFEEHG